MGTTKVTGRPTQKDIAVAAQRTQATVSMVLHKSKRPSVPAATAAHPQLAEELGYRRTIRPHVSQCRTMTLACVIPTLPSIYPGLVKGLQSVAAPAAMTS